MNNDTPLTYSEYERELERLQHGLDAERKLREEYEQALGAMTAEKAKLEARIKELEDKLVQVYERSRKCE